MAGEKSGKVGAVYAQTGSLTLVDDEKIGIANGTVFYLVQVLNTCDADTDWSTVGGALTIDTALEKEGTGCLKDNVSSPSGATEYETIYNPSGTWDWHDVTRLSFWLRCKIADGALTWTRLILKDSEGDESYWDLTFGADAWTRFDLLLGTPTGKVGADHCDLTKVDSINFNFKATDGTTFYKLIDWIGLTPEGIARDVTIKVDTTAVAEDTYVLTPSGTLTFASAPATGDITATYNYYAVDQITGFFSWNFSWAGEVLEVTDYSDSGVRTYIPALKGWTASAERHWLSTETMDGWLATERIVKFFTDASSDPRLRYEGWAIITGDSVTSAVDALVNESLSFQGCGLLTYVDE